MPAEPVHSILTINTGSSSLKVALHEFGPEEKQLLSGRVERIGEPGARLHLQDARGANVLEEEGDFADHAAALQAILAWLSRHRSGWRPDAVGHRLVHGGLHHRAPERVTPELIAALEGLVPIVPDHLPQALQAIRVVSQAYPDLPQVACFDTAFHRQMPRRAQIYPLPRRFAEEGVIRYGFHGLSYEYIVQTLRTVAPREAEGRVLIAHLGSGASMAAVHGGVGVDTTMGMTPTGGLMMGTRSGDLDPGVLLYLLSERRMSPGDLNDLVNRQAGLRGVSGSSADMRDLLAAEATDPCAAEAIALYCYQARKHLGALVAVLGGLDTLVFTGGVGEHAAPIRLRICDGLPFLGILIDPQSNETNAPIISREDSRVRVRVIPTDEDRMIARHTRELQRSRGEGEDDGKP